MNNLSPIQNFLLFSLEGYKEEEKISGAEALRDFEEYDVFNFLENGFDVLHTQSKKYIVDEIIVYIEQRK